MKYLILPILVLFVVCCGRSQSQLRTDLRSIESEMSRIASAARDCQSVMDQSGFDSFVGSFAAGYGVTSGDADLAFDGAATAVSSESRYASASRTWSS